MDDSGHSNDPMIPEFLYDRITGGILKDPVIAEDGQTYSRSSIEFYFKSRDNLNLPIISPWTRSVIGKSLIDNVELRAALNDFYLRSSPNEEIVYSTVAEATDVPEVRFIRDLGEIFTKLDDLRDFLDKTLNGWSPPHIVVIGTESSGKSTVLERLSMMSIFPRAEDICTRLPIHVHLRRGQTYTLPRLVVRNLQSKSIEKEYEIPMDTGHRCPL